MCLYIATASHSIPACHYYSYSSRYTKTLKQTFCVRKDSVFRGQISLKVKSNASQRPTINLKPKAVQVDVVQGNSSKYKAPMPYLISGDPFIETLLKLHNPASLIASSHTHRNFWDATRKQMMCVSKVIDITTNYLGTLKIRASLIIYLWRDRSAGGLAGTWGPLWWSPLSCYIISILRIVFIAHAHVGCGVDNVMPSLESGASDISSQRAALVQSLPTEGEVKMRKRSKLAASWSFHV